MSFLFSVGILRYLCREKNVPDHWYPSESKAQAKVDEYLEWQHLGTRAGCGMYFRVTVRNEALLLCMYVDGGSKFYFLLLTVRR